MLGLLAGLGITLCGQAAIPDSLEALAKKYQLKIELLTESRQWNFSNYRVEADAPSPSDLERYTKLFVSEWERYPPSVIQSARLKRIVIGSNIRMNGQVRAAVPAFEADTMFYDTTLGAKNPSYQRSVIHHEFFHMMDERQGLLYGDPEWGGLNPAGFHYGNGGDKMRTRGTGILSDSLPYVLTPYASSDIAEDKAEFFSHMLVDPEFVAKRAKADPVISAKVDLMKRRLNKWNSAFDDGFWKTKAAGFQPVTKRPVP